MATIQKTLRTCKNGHKYYKSSDCPVCPVCENERKPANGFLSLLSAPARRALENAGIKTLKQLSDFTEEELLKLHGFGKTALLPLRKSLQQAGLGLKNKKLTSAQFLAEVKSSVTNKSTDNSRYFSDANASNKFLNVRMADIFKLAKKFTSMSLVEIDKLLASDYYEARMGAVSIMDFQARDKKVTSIQRKELYNLFMKRHARINNWDLVDRSAPYVVGGYLSDKSRTPLYKLAKSKNVWERRTAIVSTYYFIRQNDVDDTFKIAKLLVHDKHDMVNKAVGSWVREAGKRDPKQLINFLDKYFETMPRITLRCAVEKLEKSKKNFYLKASQ